MASVFKALSDKDLIKLLAGGGVGVLPTDTVYGLVCLAADAKAVAKLYQLKNSRAKPGTVIAASIDQLTELGIKRSYLKAVEQFWPGPVSVVVPFSNPSGSYLRQGLNDIAVRLPADKSLQALLSKTGALMTTSANPPGRTPAENIEQAKKYFNNEVDFYVGGGDLQGRQPSTVIKIIDDAVEVLRQGSVKIENNEIAK